jgi:transposase
MPKPRRTFTAEFKKQMVQLYESGKTRANIIKEYDLGASAFDRWIAQSQKTGSFKEKDNRTEEENELELLVLRKENQRLKMENDILKQAALIMGRK